MNDLIRFPEQNNGLPIVSGDAMDQAAEDIVRFLQPLLFSDQVDATDLKILFHALSEQGWRYYGRFLSSSGILLGACVWKGGRYSFYQPETGNTFYEKIPAHAILMDRRLYDRRKQMIYRFTLAHEIGHALLHGDFSSSEANMKEYGEGMKSRFADSEGNFYLRDSHRLRTAYDWMEWQANAFASAVLMPKSLVLKVAELLLPDRNDLATGDSMQSVAADYLNELMITIHDVFKVSESAAFYRMRGLSLLPENAKRLSNGVIVLEDRNEF